MQRLLNDGWSFVKLESGSALEQAKKAEWREVALPHDWLIEQTDDLYESSDGWYRRTVEVPAEQTERVWILRFDGVYMDADVLLNGEVVRTHRYGYTAFDATLPVRAGANEVMVHVRHQSPNSRWYSGAGIFRDVTLYALPKRHIALDGVYVTSRPHGGSGEWRLHVQTEIVGGEGEPPRHWLEDENGELVARGEGEDVTLTVEKPKLWSCDEPNLYTLYSELGDQRVRQIVGFRHFTFTPDEGLFLNGEPLKLYGVCLHHDLGGLGSAFHTKAALRQLRLMRGMGVNAIRTSHNPPARQMLTLCDSMGILVVDEVLDMWLRPKTPYDYARFFEECVAEDVASWVRRDRNHPCLLMWSIGNEILDTHVDESAQETTRMLCAHVRKHDPKANAPTTFGSNFMPWEPSQRCAEWLDVVGYNYGEKYYASHHAKYPHWVIYGSETASVLASRGVYHFPLDTQLLSDEDLQCSALGNSNTSWGARDLRECIVEDINNPYSLGQFIWAGIDYLGEPTPYHTRNCYFGCADTACFPKDSYYLYQSLWRTRWTRKPMVHIGVTWDWNVGQMIDIPVMTNAAWAELFLNGVSQGRKAVDARSVESCQPRWRLPFTPGTLEAVAYDAHGEEIARAARVTPGESARIELSAEDLYLNADGEDITFITISAVDAQGNPVDNAADRVQVEVTGAGFLLALDNGDSADTEPYRTTTRRLFNGKLLAIVGAGGKAGDVRVRVTSPTLPEATLKLAVLPADAREGSATRAACPSYPMPNEIPARAIRIHPLDGTRLTPEHPTARFTASLLPANADEQPIAWRVTNDGGVDSPCASVSADEGGVTVTALGDGSIRLRATCCNGAEHPRVISELELTVEGFGEPNLNPYEFVSAGLYDLSEGDIGAGNERGVSFARDGYSMVGFSRVDFGAAGSDEMTLPIFALDANEYPIDVWEGDPRHGGERLTTLTYQKPSIWNVYQPETYRLPRRLRGLTTLCFTMDRKVHLKGFQFARQSRAWLALSALDADEVYGDSFRRAEDGIVDIGNNVTLLYRGMDFGDARSARLTLDGRTPLTQNPVTVRFERADGARATALARFAGGERGEQTFDVELPGGVCDVSLVFLPGSRFDLYGVRFEKAE